MDTDNNQNEQKKDMTDLEQSLKAEIDEIMKYKWYMGENMNRDPLEVHSLDEICRDWIIKYAKEFRKNWENRKNMAQ